MTAIEIQGTLHADGTLVLDRKPDLSPGRVKVTVEPVHDHMQTEMWQFFQQIKAEREALGLSPTPTEEIDSYLATLRDEQAR